MKLDLDLMEKKQGIEHKTQWGADLSLSGLNPYLRWFVLLWCKLETT